MSSLQHIKKRLSGIRNINQMTRAMELVAATKMRRAQEAALSSRPYAFTALEILANVVEYLASAEGQKYQEAVKDIKLIHGAVNGRIAILLIAADKGLAGSFNSSVFRRLEKFIAASGLDLATCDFIPVGQKAIEYVKRQGYSVLKEFSRYGDMAHLEEVLPLAEFILATHEQGNYSKLLVFSTHFFSALKQDVVERQLLPVEFSKIRETVEEIIPETGRYSEFRRELLESRPEEPIEYIIEPSPAEALNHLLPLLFKMQVYHLILEANAAEHSARRLAMKNASDNAKDFISKLVLEYNRSRQASITKEIIEITSTTAALKK